MRASHFSRFSGAGRALKPRGPACAARDAARARRRARRDAIVTRRHQQSKNYQLRPVLDFSVGNG